MRERLRATLAVLVVVISGMACKDPVRRVEELHHAKEPLAAFRAANAALKAGELEEPARKRIYTVLILSARTLLTMPDPSTREEAFELFEAMPKESDEREGAAQRLFRVMVATTRDPSELTTALAALEPEMGEESSVRSNLRLIAERSRGTPGGTWAARTVVDRWPDDADRWVDLAASQAGEGMFDDAVKTMDTALEKLDEYCTALPARIAAYDKVRRLSAYAQHELRRCDAFPSLVARRWAFAHKQAQPAAGPTHLVDVSVFPVVSCPGSAGAMNNAAAGDAVFAVSPSSASWWVAGKSAGSGHLAVTSGTHEVTIRDGAACRKITHSAEKDSVNVFRLHHPHAPPSTPDASPPQQQGKAAGK